MESLSREQAIKRIRDIQGGKIGYGMDKDLSFINLNMGDSEEVITIPQVNMVIGAMLELMAIFDIKEEEL